MNSHRLAGAVGRLRLKQGSKPVAWYPHDVVISRDHTGETVLLNLPTGTYLNLDRSAARIVSLLNDEPNPRRAADELVAQFGIPFDQALGDVYAVIAAVRGLSAPRTNRGRRPTVAGVRVVALSWFRQPRQFQLATARATMAVVVIEVGLRLVSVRRLSSWMGVPLATDPAPPPPPNLDDLSGLSDAEARVYWAVQWVLARWLYDATCLRRALAFGWFIRKRKPVLRLGMMDDSSTVAHAWIEVQDMVFNAQPVTGTFAASAVNASQPGAIVPITDQFS